jgi:hypothetical protein
MVRFANAMQAGGGRDQIGKFFRLASKSALEKQYAITAGADRYSAALSGQWEVVQQLAAVAKAARPDGESPPPGNGGLVRIRYKPERGRSWVEEAVTAISPEELRAAIRMIALPALTAATAASERGEGSNWLESAPDDVRALVSGLTYKEMAVVSPRLFWASMRHFPHPLTHHSVLTVVLPEVDWAATEQRLRKPSQKAIDAMGSASSAPATTGKPAMVGDSASSSRRVSGSLLAWLDELGNDTPRLRDAAGLSAALPSITSLLAGSPEAASASSSGSYLASFLGDKLSRHLVGFSSIEQVSSAAEPGDESDQADSTAWQGLLRACIGVLSESACRQCNASQAGQDELSGLLSSQLLPHEAPASKRSKPGETSASGDDSSGADEETSSQADEVLEEAGATVIALAELVSHSCGLAIAMARVALGCARGSVDVPHPVASCLADAKAMELVSRLDELFVVTPQDLVALGAEELDQGMQRLSGERSAYVAGTGAKLVRLAQDVIGQQGNAWMRDEVSALFA